MDARDARRQGPLRVQKRMLAGPRTRKVVEQAERGNRSAVSRIWCGQTPNEPGSSDRSGAPLQPILQSPWFVLGGLTLMPALALQASAADAPQRTDPIHLPLTFI